MSIFTNATPAAVRRALLAKTEIALVDVRHESRFATGHPLFAASFPLGHLEVQAADRLPRRAVPIVVYGDGADDTLAAADRLRELGYTDVSLLAGGLDGWTADGGELFQDVNAPSKAFGELVAETAGTPSLAADEVAALLRSGSGRGGTAAVGSAPVIIVDARRFDEYATMSIPTATSVPGAELALRVRALAPDPATTVVVNCAGRTRSIIGTQSLINAGLPNPIFALRNGTIGWTLAGLELDHGQARRAADAPPETARQADAAAWAVAEQAGVRRIASDEPPRRDDGQRTVYRFDVRTQEEYETGHLTGFLNAPGGQLVQETDWYAPVRGALIILADDGAGRAAMTASWLAQMGWDTAVAGAGQAGPSGTTRPPAPDVPLTTPAAAADWLRARHAAVVDVGHQPPVPSRPRPRRRLGAAGRPVAAGAAQPSRPAGPAGPHQLGRLPGDLGGGRAKRGRRAGPGARPGRRHRCLGTVGPPAGIRAGRDALARARRLPPSLRGHRHRPGRHAGLPRLGVRPGGTARAGRDARVLGAEALRARAPARSARDPTTPRGAGSAG